MDHDVIDGDRSRQGVGLLNHRLVNNFERAGILGLGGPRMAKQRQAAEDRPNIFHRERLRSRTPGGQLIFFDFPLRGF